MYSMYKKSLLLTLCVANSLSAGLWDSFKNRLPALTVKNVLLGACVTYTACSLGRSLGKAILRYFRPQPKLDRQALFNAILHDAADTQDPSHSVQEEPFLIPNPQNIPCTLNLRAATAELNILTLTANNHTYTVYEQRLPGKNVLSISNGHHQCLLEDNHPLAIGIRERLRAPHNTLQ